MTYRNPSLRFLHALILFQYALVLCPCRARAAAPRDHVITVAPAADDMKEMAEPPPIRKRIEEHNNDLQRGEQYAYIAVLKGESELLRKGKLSVRINGQDVSDVLIHNSTTLSFRIPHNIALDEKMFASSWLEIEIGSNVGRKIPLFVLDNAIVKVDLNEYRNKIKRQREGSLEDMDISVASPSQSVRTNIKSQANSQGESQASSQKQANSIHYEHELSTNQQQNTPPTNTNKDAKQAQEQLSENYVKKLLSEAEQLLGSEKRSSVSKAVELLELAISYGSVQAMTVLSSLLLSGTTPGIKRDIRRAVSYLHTAGGKGYPDAQALLGFLYASGIAAPVLEHDVGAAILMWTFAAEGGSLHAKMALAFRYFTGTDIAEDCEKAAEYYQQVAEDVFHSTKQLISLSSSRSGDIDAEYRDEIQPPTSYTMQSTDRKRLREHMRRRVLGEANDVIQYYRRAADRGDANAQVMIGSLYYYGDADMPRNTEKARRLFELAAAAGKAEAHAHLGFMDLRAGNNGSALHHLEIAAVHSDRFGLNGMGFLHFHGIGVARDETKAAKFFMRAAEMELPEAMFNLAILYSRGLGVSESMNEAFRLFQAAAQKGHMRSSYHLGIMMMKGKSPVAKHCAMATQYLRVVAEQGDWNNILSLAFRAYERGAYGDALYRYLQAAHAGIELAQFNAAFMYEQNTLTNVKSIAMKYFGSGDDASETEVPEREVAVEEALSLYQMSASQGYADSMVRMGDLAFEECKDYSRAAASYERAVKLRNAEAMFNLGWMHARGFGMNADQHMAKRYFDLAKETDGDAVIPATIAVYSLAYSDSLEEMIDSCSAVMRRIGSYLGADDDTTAPWNAKLMDGIVLSLLLGVLVVVINVRQRRLMAVQADGGEADGEENGVEVERTGADDRGGEM